MNTGNCTYDVCAYLNCVHFYCICVVKLQLKTHLLPKTKILTLCVTTFCMYWIFILSSDVEKLVLVMKLWVLHPSCLYVPILIHWKYVTNTVIIQASVEIFVFAFLTWFKLDYRATKKFDIYNNYEYISVCIGWWNLMPIYAIAHVNYYQCSCSIFTITDNGVQRWWFSGNDNTQKIRMLRIRINAKRINRYLYVILLVWNLVWCTMSFYATFIINTKNVFFPSLIWKCIRLKQLFLV